MKTCLRTKLLLIILASFLMITGCAIDTGVIPLNNHTYTITKQAATGFTAIYVVKQAVLQEAAKYCDIMYQHNKTLKIITLQQTLLDTQTYVPGIFPRVDMTFSCESNSTEYTTAPIKVKPLNLEEFKTQCKELGFKVGTADYGNCVLQLNESK